MSQVRVIRISDDRRLIGEGPHWMDKGQSLLYVDILKGTAHRYFNESKRHQTLQIEDVGTGDAVSFIVPVEGRQDEYVVGIGRTLASVKWSAEDPDHIVKKPYPLLSVDLHDSGTRFNDAKCDPAGRLWAGTMSIETGVAVNVPHKGTLYRIDPNLKAHACAHKVTISNGLSWSKDRKTLYYIDSLEFRVDAFDYNHASGDISNRRPVIDFKASDIKGFPDGMAIDTDDNLWIACFNGAQVICVDPAIGKVIRKVELDSLRITSCCWGGPDYSTLFVTSGDRNMSEEDMKKFPDAGKTFAITGLGAKGFAPNELRVDENYCLK